MLSTFNEFYSTLLQDLRGMSLVMTLLSLFVILLSLSLISGFGWHQMNTNGDEPGTRIAHSFTSDGEHTIWLFGGLSYLNFSDPVSEQTFSNDMFALDLDNEEWSLVGSGTKPSVRGYHGAFHVKTSTANRIIIHGGSTYEVYNSTHPGYHNIVVFNDTWSYDINAGKWTQIISNYSPGKRTSFCATKDSNKNGWVFGGFRLGTTGLEALNDLWRFDSPTNQWEEVVPDGSAGSPPKRFSGHISYGPFDTLLLFSGRNTTYVFKDMWRYNITAGTWQDITPTEYYNVDFGKIEYNTVSMVDQYMITMGGQDGDLGSAGCGSPEIQGPSSATWVWSYGLGYWQIMYIDPPSRNVLGHGMDNVGSLTYTYGGMDWECPGRGVVPITEVSYYDLYEK